MGYSVVTSICGFWLQHFFASFLSRDEAFRLIVDGWIQHSSYAKLYLNSQGSLASLAVVGDTLMLSKAQGCEVSVAARGIFHLCHKMVCYAINSV
jgi:hypothetical protein